MSTGAAGLDMAALATPGALQTAGFCVLPLADIWLGRRGDMRMVGGGEAGLRLRLGGEGRGRSAQADPAGAHAPTGCAL
jgi:hypothetical protein